MTEEGSLNEEQKDLISSALSFGDVTVESILTSRVDVAAIDVDMSEKEILDIIKEQNHSRIPVYEGTIDNIIGILQIRKYIKYYIRTAGQIIKVIERNDGINIYEPGEQVTVGMHPVNLMSYPKQ